MKNNKNGIIHKSYAHEIRRTLKHWQLYIGGTLISHNIILMQNLIYIEITELKKQNTDKSSQKVSG